MLYITDNIEIPEKELELRFIRASGPGGQNVNKVASAVQLRFDVAASSALPEDVRQRLVKLAGRKLTTEGVLVIEARRHRTQQANREDAVERLVALIRRAARRPKSRRRSRPTAASREKRLGDKRHRSKAKQRRQRPADADD